MFEGEPIGDFLGYSLYKCPDGYRAVRGEVVLFGITIEGLKMRITEMHEKIQGYWSKADRRRHKGVYMNEFEKELNRREMDDIKNEMAKMKEELRELQQAKNQIKKMESIIDNLNTLCCDLGKDGVIEQFSDGDGDGEHGYEIHGYVYKGKPYEIDGYSF